MQFPNHPKLNALISRHASSPSALGPHWPKGRKIVEKLLDPIPFPVPVPQPRIDEFDYSSWDETSAIRLKTEEDGKPWLMYKMFTLETLEGYLRTFSALHEYHEKIPEDKEKKGRGKDGDIVDRLMGEIGDGLREEGPKGGEAEGEILGGWPLVLMMIKKKPVDPSR